MASVEELRALCEQHDITVVADVETEATGWTPGLVVAMRSDDSRLAPLRAEYRILNSDGNDLTVVEVV